MAVSRRNTLIGLGALVGGAGVFAATGAFTTVEAQRTVDIETAGDAGGLLGLEPGPEASVVSVDGADTIIEFDFEAGEGGQLNLRARTGFDLELRVANNSDNTIHFDIHPDDDSKSLIGGVQSNDTVLTFEVNDSDEETIDDPTIDSSGVHLGSGDSIDFDIEIDFFDDAVDWTNYDDVSPPIDTTTKGDNALANDLAGDDNDFLVFEANQE